MSDELECTEACGGNGYIDCWQCGGDGEYEVPDDDMTTRFRRCEICRGRGGWPCPACVQAGRVSEGFEMEDVL